jgi:hypothetical protein
MASLFFILKKKHSNIYHNKPKKPKHKSNLNNFIQKILSFKMVGILLIISSAFLKKSQPVLSNYIPILTHPIFFTGISMLALSIIYDYLYSSRFKSKEAYIKLPLQAIFGLKCTAISFILCAISTLLSIFSTSTILPIQSYYELIFWGPGHLLQICSQIGMLSVCIILIFKIIGYCPINIIINKIIFISLIISCLIGTLLPIFGTNSYIYIYGSTILMKFGICPFIVIFLIIFLYKITTIKKKLINNLYFNGFISSVFLTLFGYILGFCINKQNTLIPAHYHATIGGVSIAFMSASFWLCEVFGIKNNKKFEKLTKLQPICFCLGQFIFVLGFSFAGIHGALRKTFGSEQILHSLTETVSLTMMGIGGITAIISGILFLYLCSKKVLFIIINN